MFKKVLIADDLGSINQGVLSELGSLMTGDVQSVQYCDDAFLKIKKAIYDNNPFELLITDLSFKADHREQKYKSGEELISALQKEVPELKVIIYSVEDRLQKIRKLMGIQNVKGYVCKGRKGLWELSDAVNTIYENKQFVSPQIEQALSHKDNLEITDYDIALVKQLSEGLSQEEVSIYLKKNNISPNSLSSVEKRLNKLKDQFKANNAIHLVAIVKDLGLI